MQPSQPQAEDRIPFPPLDPSLQLHHPPSSQSSLPKHPSPLQQSQSSLNHVSRHQHPSPLQHQVSSSQSSQHRRQRPPARNSSSPKQSSSQHQSLRHSHSPPRIRNRNRHSPQQLSDDHPPSTPERYQSDRSPLRKNSIARRELLERNRKLQNAARGRLPSRSLEQLSLSSSRGEPSLQKAQRHKRTIKVVRYLLKKTGLRRPKPRERSLDSIDRSGLALKGLSRGWRRLLGMRQRPSRE